MNTPNKSGKFTFPQLSFVLQGLPKATTAQQVEEALASFTFKKVTMLETVDQQKALGTEEYEKKMKAPDSKLLEQTMAAVEFEAKQDLVALAQAVLIDKKVKIGDSVASGLRHKRFGDYNSKSSVYVGMLNPRCNELDLITELATLTKGSGFVLSCLVVTDQETKRSKQFAFVDFSTEAAADLVVKKWHNMAMEKYPNRLMVTKFEADHQKMTQRERERSRVKNPFTNLYVEKLPYSFNEPEVLKLFAKFGKVTSIKLKKPKTNVPLSDMNLLPCSAYVNFSSEAEAKTAVEGLNGHVVLAGTNPLRVDYYQRANRFLGAFSGLDRQELINNTHFRVLFIKGLFKGVSREQLREACEEFGIVESLALKTKIENQQTVSRGIAIVQYATKAEASVAMQKLPFVEELGDFLDIDFYQSKESRLKTLEFEQQKPLMQIWSQTAAIGPQLIQLKNQSLASDKRKRPTPKRGRQPERTERTKKASPKKVASPEQPKKVYRQKGSSEDKKDAPKPAQGSGIMNELMKAKKQEPQVLVEIPMENLNALKTDAEKKQFLGNYLYQFVKKKMETEKEVVAEKKEEYAGRVTGMILEGQTIDYILYLCQNKAAFMNIVDQALKMIKEYDAKQA